MLNNHYETSVMLPACRMEVFQVGKHELQYSEKQQTLKEKSPL